jgi:hypothetical protein
MNKEHEDILNEVYDNYVKIVESNKELYLERDGYIRNILTKDDFIKESKYNNEFSEKWDLKIKERELSDDERYNLLSDTEKRSFIVTIIPGVEYGEEVKYTLDTFYKHVPTKLITINYNDKTIESYE